MGVVDAVAFAGICIFQVEIYLMIGEWSRNWNDTIGAIEGFVKAADLSPQLLETKKLLFDSKKMIEETRDDLTSAAKDFHWNAAKCPEVIRSNWKMLVSGQNKAVMALLKRIDKLQRWIDITQGKNE